MKIETRLSELDHAQVVEAVHLLSRYLVESPRNREQLQEVLAIDARGGSAVQTAVLGVVDDIEHKEGAQIESISAAAKMKYVEMLDRLLWTKVDDDRANQADVANALEELRKVS